MSVTLHLLLHFCFCLFTYHVSERACVYVRSFWNRSLFWKLIYHAIKHQTGLTENLHNYHSQKGDRFCHYCKMQEAYMFFSYLCILCNCTYFVECYASITEICHTRCIYSKDRQPHVTGVTSAKTQSFVFQRKFYWVQSFRKKEANSADEDQLL